MQAYGMRFRIAALVGPVAAGAALGAAVSGGFVATAPAGPPPPPVKYYDPLPR